ncbi:MAG: stage III sporulation protein AB [Oscillospiraceae bacterium]|nr:stage III sporulation protein AB [Oscillospiraceae bacterium]
MRLLGIVLLSCSCLMTAALELKRRRERICSLRDLSDGMTLLQGELALRGTSLPRLFCDLEARSSGAARLLFESLGTEMERLGEERFTDIWSSCVYACTEPLEAGEREALLCLGEILGRMELEDQTAELLARRDGLRESLARAEERYPEDRRLCLGLGAAAALMLTIVLL